VRDLVTEQDFAATAPQGRLSCSSFFDAKRALSAQFVLFNGKAGLALHARSALNAASTSS